MNELVDRMTRTGVPPHEAYRTIYDFLKNYGVDALMEYIDDLEKSAYVG